LAEIEFFVNSVKNFYSSQLKFTMAYNDYYGRYLRNLSIKEETLGCVNNTCLTGVCTEGLRSPSC